MSEPRYPNESQKYREARDALLKDEQELIAKMKALAAKRRKLPLGGELKEDYVFQWANEGKVGERVKFSELFGDKNTLILYSWMFGPNWDNPCPSCTSLMDGFDRAWYSVNAGRRVRRDRQGAGRKNQCVGDEARMVTDPASVRLRVAVSGGLQMPGAGQRRQATAGDAHFHQARRKDLSFLGDGDDAKSRRYGVAVLEPVRLHAGGPAGS